jgi:hypothetical protein
MTGDQDENEDILGFGNTDHAPPAFRAMARLDRLVLRATRRPHWVAISAGLIVAVLVAGAVAYLSPAHAPSRPTAAQPRPVASQCPPVQSKLLATEIRKLLKQMRKVVSDTPPAYSSTLTITSGSTSVTSTTSGITSVEVTC